MCIVWFLLFLKHFLLQIVVLIGKKQHLNL